MIRFNLNKISLLIFFLFSELSFGFSLQEEKKIVDSYGKPIPHALVKIEGEKVLLVDEKGVVSLDQTADKIIVFALGYESLQLTWEEWESKKAIILLEKSGNLQEVVVSATRTERSVEQLPMPVTVLNTIQIQNTGGVRLSEVLREQTGLQITSNHGSGLQMQGLDSDYILILLDGEPMIGRTAGTFDLDRISVSNIERIEILRGPSSAIYGSEAMGGVINIITKSYQDKSDLNLGLRHRSFNTWNPYFELGIGKDKLNAQIFIDHLQSDGFDLTPEVIGQTQNPYKASTAQVKVSGMISDKLSFNLFGRGYLENSYGILQTTGSTETELLDLDNQRGDINFNPTLRFKPNADWTFTLRGMSSWFSTRSESNFRTSGEIFEFQEFDQFFHRTELQTDFMANSKNLITLGVGQSVETVEATRFEELNRFDAGYIFLQHIWDPLPNVNFVSGLRADFHSQFGNRLSPKISGQYQISENFSWQASLGAGFKAPDFRQLLLNFNNAAAGYYVFGANLASDGITKLQEQGLVAQVLINPSSIGQLDAETSRALNTGFRWKPSSNSQVTLNAYRNEIDNLIETAPIAQLVTGQNAFSYFNISSVVTQGLEVDVQVRLLENLRLSAGYAFLDTKDVEVIQQIENGEIFKRNDQNQTRRVTRSDYGGLFNRSRHSGNLKLNYQEKHSGIDLAFRAIFRGKFGFADLNGNLILDDESEYAPSWISYNMTATKTFENGMFLEIGGTNLLNTITAAQPNNPGRVIFLGVKLPILNLINR
ncbi:outer membrane cobalamin receptor protein [Belliella baltica DSM 15883]|uniref:Outer membrane cobalamin receptor protein n=1 Tax=Belliella baltica (strain DSM 15883 / CIP 108006 / LMG 21964 / BA134) TaxID=866536 RepID=I3Z2F1_BELBD|nr:TonB-dependent receptor [Belliella baltica]AFL83419.1 outer membrane cobalamin receptor protein [Belliella baltica DSM 15883]